MNQEWELFPHAVFPNCSSPLANVGYHSLLIWSEVSSVPPACRVKRRFLCLYERVFRDRIAAGIIPHTLGSTVVRKQTRGSQNELRPGGSVSVRGLVSARLQMRAYLESRIA